MVTKLQHSQADNLDVDSVVKFFGGRAALVKDLVKHQIVQLHVTAIDKWKARGKIPAARKADLQTLARAKRKKFDFKQFPQKKAG